MTTTDVVVQAFTELAPRYEDTFDRELRAIFGLGYSDFVQRLVDLVPLDGNAVILDVATGTAQIPLSIASRANGHSVAIGLDITPAMLKRGLANIRAKGLNQRVKLVCASAMEMPFTEGLFDAVICGFGMHHLNVPRALAEIRRVLKVGGQLLIACETAPSFWRSSLADVVVRFVTPLCALARMSARVQAELAAIANIHTAAEWRAILSDFGFGQVKAVARFQGRRPWFPSAIALQATRVC